MINRLCVKVSFIWLVCLTLGCTHSALKHDALVHTSTQAVSKHEKDVVIDDVVMIVINDPRGDNRKFGGTNPLYSANISYDQDPLLNRISKKLLRDYALTSQEQWPIKSLGVHCIVVKMPSAQVLSQLKRDHRVAWVQNFNTFETQFSSRYSPAPQNTLASRSQTAEKHIGVLKSDGSKIHISNTYHSKATHLKPHQAYDVHHALPLKLITPNISLPNLARGVKIMVIDTGANTRHPAFKQTSFTYKNFVQHKKDAMLESHGLAVTGLLGARAETADMPVKGLTQDASLYHYRGCWQSRDGGGKCSTLTLALALDAALQVAPDVINLSLSGPSDRILEALLDKLIARGTIVVSAFDAKRSAQARFPRAQSGVIYAFGMADNDITRGEKGVDNAAYRPAMHDGSDVQSHSVSALHSLPKNTFKASSTALSLAPDGSYDTYTGHSIAAPQVTATVASLMAKDPSISKDTVARKLAQWLAIP